MTQTDSFRSSAWFIVAVVCISVFTDSLAFGVVIPVLPPVLLKDAKVPEHEVQSWLSCMLALYGSALLVFSPVFGYVSDRYWKKGTCLMAGLPAMAVSLIIFMGFRTSPLAMAVARTLQGISSAAVGVGAMALVLDTLGSEKAAIGVSFYIVANCMSNALSPMLGGILYDNLGYDAVFTIPATLLFLDSLLLLSIKLKTDDNLQRSSNVVFVEDGSHYNSWVSANRNLPVPTERSPLLRDEPKDKDLMYVSVVECREESSMLDLLKDKRMLNAICVVIFCQSIFAAFETTLPLFLLQKFAWSPTKTGLLFLACSLPKLVSPVAGKIVDHYGARYPTVIAAAVCLGCLLCLQAVRSNGLQDKVILIVFLSMNNTAASIIETAMIAEIGIVAGMKDLIAQGGALVNVALAAGLMMGPVMGGYVYQYFGWQAVTVSLGLSWILLVPGIMLFAGRKRN